MSDPRAILEQYLNEKLHDKAPFVVTDLSKLADGWESDNYKVTVEYGGSRRRNIWVWRIYSGVGSREKAVREFTSMEKLSAAGYPVPRVFLLEAGHSQVERPFVIMEHIQGEMMWHLLDQSSAEREAQLIDQFCRLLARLHKLDSTLFEAKLPDDDPFFFIDRWLEGARSEMGRFPEFDAASFLDWVAARRTQFACKLPAPVHMDFHPGNVLVKPDQRGVVIDWTGFEITDPRFDLGWTLVLAYAHGRPGWRDQIYEGYQRHAGTPMRAIEDFEALACARRLFGLTVSLTQGAQHMGMNVQAIEAMRASMEAHRRVYRLFSQHTGLLIETFEDLFG